MKSTLAAIALFASLTTNASNLNGQYHCSVSYKEMSEISIINGEDFPTFGGNLETPRVRNEVIRVLMNNNDMGWQQATILNPETLPNFLLLRGTSFRQSSFGHYADNGKLESIQIDFSGNWYFGSRVDMDIKSSTSNKLIVDMSFDDNDGWRSTVRNITCLK
jgi:hypothetical protein